MTTQIPTSSNAANLRFAIAVARFNTDITDNLLAGALQAIEENGGSTDNIAIAQVPGSLELPLVAQRLAQSQNYDAVIVLGCVIRGETGHYDCVVNGVQQGITRVNLDTNIPVMFGVITSENRDQAEARSDRSRKANLGYDAAIGAIQMAHLLKQI